MTIRYQFNFENSGQGLFYNGEIDQFNIIYDCGSENKRFLNKCINDYKETWHLKRKKQIDLLILSHFHKDHVNGLDKLLENAKLDTVVFPYMDPVEKLYLLNNRNFINSNNKQLLINPIDYFIQKGVRQIILIKKTELKLEIPKSESKNESDLNIENINTNDIESNIHFNNSERDIILENTIIAGNRKLRDKIIVLEGTSYIHLSNIWKFLFFNLKRDDNQLKNFKQAILKIQNDLKINFDNPYELQECLKNEELRKKIAECYKEFKGNYNSTSLCCYHGPNTIRFNIGYISMKSMQTYGSKCFKTVFGTDFFSPINTLLTGDISLKNENWEPFVEHYKKHLNDIRITLIPHHGSIHNWNNQILEVTPKCKYWITSSGFSNRYRHPNIDVLLNLIEANKDVLNCNELSKVRIEGELHF
ncbi:hypothetical protein COI60_31380 [Bacillus toyonensis]|uniref:MBL fold metallo-hydrolase n=1 Tax=Bacillus toyonensis TaxID=155322 RepID=UPI000BFDA2D7|nr:MBL fold metallo-hydrolase [Bacillus toyonensis]PHG27294.1 hypothetical protein COI60_31380 [Bacillus toyonensis]